MRFGLIFCGARESKKNNKFVGVGPGNGARIRNGKLLRRVAVLCDATEMKVEMMRWAFLLLFPRNERLRLC